MGQTWLILDSNYLCWRDYHAVKSSLQHEGFDTTVVYGFLRDLVLLEDRFATNNIAFCFDSGKSLRKQRYPLYKANRLTAPLMGGLEKKQQEELRVQIKKLRDEYLPSVGFKNIFHQEGYEADDCIASLCKSLPSDDYAILVSSDHDLYQLLRGNVSLWNPKTKVMFSVEDFEMKFGLKPHDWITVKALGGCRSDNIRGIHGVAEKSVVQYLTGKMGKKGKKYADLESQKDETYERNCPLVELPYPGTPEFKLSEDKISMNAWRGLLKKLGIKTIGDLMPISRGFA